MTDPQKSKPADPAPSDDELLDEALNDPFPASDPVEPTKREKLPPADPPGSDVRDQ